MKLGFVSVAVLLCCGCFVLFGFVGCWMLWVCLFGPREFAVGVGVCFALFEVGVVVVFGFVMLLFIHVLFWFV